MPLIESLHVVTICLIPIISHAFSNPPFHHHHHHHHHHHYIPTPSCGVTLLTGTTPTRGGGDALESKRTSRSRTVEYEEEDRWSVTSPRSNSNPSSKKRRKRKDGFREIGDALELTNRHSDKNDDDDDDDDYYDYYDEEEEDDTALEDGNYWINEHGDTDVSYEEEWEAEEDDFYDLPRPMRSKSRRGKRSTYPSNTPKVPPLLQQLYSTLFWYGMDMSSSTSPKDRTMFGGTKGKFNALELVNDNYDDNYDDDDYDENYDDDDKKVNKSMEYNNDHDDEYEDDYDDDYDYEYEYEYDDDYESEYESDDEYDTPNRRQPPQSVRQDYEIIKQDISTWFTPEDKSLQTSQKNTDIKDHPVEMLLDKLFNVDTQERKRLANAYDVQMGIQSTPSTIPFDHQESDQEDDTSRSMEVDSPIDVEPVVVSDAPPSPTTETVEVLPTFRMTWEERAEQVSRIPPTGMDAWGPQGLISNKDAQESAMENAQEELKDAQDRIDYLRSRVESAHESFILLQADTRILQSRMNSMDRPRTRLRIELDRLQHQTQRASLRFRQRQNILKGAKNELTSLQKKHWALLSRPSESVESTHTQIR